MKKICNWGVLYSLNLAITNEYPQTEKPWLREGEESRLCCGEESVLSAPSTGSPLSVIFSGRFKRCVGFGFHLVVGFFLLDIKAVNWQRHDGRVVLQNERFKSISLVWYKVFISSITKKSKIRYFLLIFYNKKFFSPKIQWHQRLNNTVFFYQFKS